MIAANVCDFAEKDALTALFIQEQERTAEEIAVSEAIAVEMGDLPGEGGARDTYMHDEGIGYLPWRSGDFVFDQVQPFFDSEVYSLCLFKGLVTSSGGLTESTLKASQKTLFKYLSDMKGDIPRKSKFLGKLCQIYNDNLKDERITIPLMKTIEILLESDYLSENELAEDLKRIHGLTV